jgi:hypothetical protein
VSALKRVGPVSESLLMGAMRTPRCCAAPAADREAGTIVLGWLVRVSLLLFTFAVVAFDAAGIGVNLVQVQDDADTAASAASLSWHASHDAALSLRAAQTSMDSGAGTARVPAQDFQVRPDGQVSLTVERQARTFLIGRIAFLRKFTVARAGATSTRPAG